jgi:hypothetical protein
LVYFASSCPYNPATGIINQLNGAHKTQVNEHLKKEGITQQQEQVQLLMLSPQYSHLETSAVD